MTTFKKIRAVIYFILFTYIIYLNQPYYQTKINKDIKPFYNEYMLLVNNKCKDSQYFHPNFKIEFKDLTDNIIGLCITYPKSFVVYLDQKFWNDNENLARFQLIAHELTHCMFFQDHIDKPNNYMAPSFNDIPKQELYKQINELLDKHCGETNGKEN